MPQAVATSAPTPPTPPQQPAQGIGDAMRGAIDEVVASALAGTRAELDGRIASLEASREALTAALKNADSRQRRAVLETQLTQVEGELAKTRSALDKIDRQLGRRDGPAPARTYSGTGTPSQFPDFPRMDRVSPFPMIIAIVGIIFIGFPIALTLSRYIWKRSTHAPAPPLTAEQTRRFDRIEQSVDAIAIEVERISENQRYLTKLLAEPKQSAKIGS
jgi:hypothetical protein